jgi:hypothetical protein
MSVHFAVPHLFAFGAPEAEASAEPWDLAPASVEAVEPEPPSLRTLFQRERLERERRQERPQQYGMAEAIAVLYQSGLGEPAPKSEKGW